MALRKRKCEEKRLKLSSRKGKDGYHIFGMI